MDRREALKNVALILGGTVISSQSFLAGCSTRDQASESEQFPQTDIDLLDEIAETIIPETDTPGAKAAEAGSFMAMMVPDCYSEKNQESFREGIEKIRTNFRNEFGHSLMDGTTEERRSFLKNLDDEMQSYNESWSEDAPAHYFRIMKELTLLGYFTSEIGCTQARRYRQTPGRYEACIDYEESERAWVAPA